MPGSSAPRLLTTPTALGVLGLGVAVRVLMLLTAGPIDLQSDEANYVHLALGLERFGVLLDCYRYLWPPAYPAFLRACFALAPDGGLDLARAVQVLASPAIGAATMAIAARLFDRRVALLAGVGWALHLPLAAFTHLLWSETLFLALWLPAVALLLRALDAREREPVGELLLFGALAGLAVHLKEAPLYLVPLLVVPLLAARWRRDGLPSALRSASLPLLAFLVVITPWCLRNLEVYGTPTLASTLGENAYNGLNATHRNFDLIPVNTALQRAGRPILEVRAPFRDPLEGGRPVAEWPRAEELPHLPTRLAANRERGLSFAAEHPGWILRSRVQKWADLVAPVSFLTRHLTLGHYHGPLADLRPLLVALAVLCSAGTLLLGLTGLALHLPRTPAAAVIALNGLYVLATGSLVAMSRFRLPLVPLLLIGAAALVLRRGEEGPGRRAVALVLAAALAALWWIGAPTTVGLIEAAWHGLEGGDA